MFKNYLLLAIRLLSKNKTFTFINVLGLSIGIATFLVLVRYVEYEFSYDKYIPGANEIYRIDYYESQHNSPLLQSAHTQSGLSQVLQEHIPEIKAVTRFYNEQCLIFNDKAKNTDRKILWADSTFLKVFKIALLRGNPEKVLTAPNAAVISKSQALVYFGSGDPIGKTVYFNEHLPLTITGVFKDLPENSSIKFDFLVSFNTLEHYGWTPKHGDFHYPWLFTFVTLNSPKTTVAEVNTKLQTIVEKYLTTNLKNRNITGKYELRPLRKIHFASNLLGELEAGKNKIILYALVFLAFFILITAWINYINLSLARSFERVGEIGVRKVYGAGSGHITLQYLTESLIIILFTLVTGLSVYEVLSRGLAKISESTFVIASGHGWTWLVYIVLILAGTSLSTVYPAYIISKFKPALILKHKFRNKNNYLSNGLVIFQFFLSIVLIGGMLIAFKQINFIRRFDVGFNMLQTISLRGPASQNSDTLRHQRFHAFRDDVLKQEGFAAGTASMNIPGEEMRFHDERVRIAGSENDIRQSYWVSFIDNGYLETFGLKLVAGRNFEANDQKQLCLVNEAATRTLGFKNPQEAVNAEFITSNNEKVKIIGVIRDYHHESIKKPVEPCIFYDVHPIEFGYYTFRFKNTVTKDLLLVLKQTWEKHYPNDPFVYYFMDKFFERQYASDFFFERVLVLFSLLSMIIAGMGVFGLSSFSMAKRTKEIGIRKVNGAKVTDLMLLMILRYLRLFITAVIVAIPIIWLGMNKWLSNYAYRINLAWDDAIVPIVITLFIILLTLSYHVLRTVSANPVDALKDE